MISVHQIPDEILQSGKVYTNLREIYKHLIVILILTKYRPTIVMIVLYITKVHGFILGIVIMQVKHFCINNGSTSLCKRLYIYMYETKNALMYKYWYPFAETLHVCV